MLFVTESCDHRDRRLYTHFRAQSRIEDTEQGDVIGTRICDACWAQLPEEERAEWKRTVETK